MDRPQKEYSSIEYKFPTISAAALVLANLIPVVGVLFWDWNARYIIILWWAEIAIHWFFFWAKSGVVSFAVSVSIAQKVLVTPLAGFLALVLLTFMHGIGNLAHIPTIV